MGDMSVILDIKPSFALSGGEVIASLRTMDDSAWPKSKLKRLWRLRHERRWLSGSFKLDDPIRLPILDHIGTLLIEACECATYGFHKVIAQNRIDVLGSPAEMLQVAFKESDANYGAVIFNALTTQLKREQGWRDDINELLEPYFRNDHTFDRAILYALDLNEETFTNIARPLAGEYHLDLLQEFRMSVLKKSRQFDPDRGPFGAWAYQRLRDCWSAYRKRQARRQQYVVWGLNEDTDVATSNCDARRLEAEEGLAKIMGLLERRFSALSVGMYVYDRITSPSPTYLDVAERFGYRKDAKPVNRAQDVRREIERIKQYIDNHLNDVC
jgi:hypothetical protein